MKNVHLSAFERMYKLDIFTEFDDGLAKPWTTTR